MVSIEVEKVFERVRNIFYSIGAMKNNPTITLKNLLKWNMQNSEYLYFY